jgi:hypothetical protein
MPPTPKGDSTWYGPSNAELLGESLLRYRLGFFGPVAPHKFVHQRSVRNCAPRRQADAFLILPHCLLEFAGTIVKIAQHVARKGFTGAY